MRLNLACPRTKQDCHQSSEQQIDRNQEKWNESTRMVVRYEFVSWHFQAREMIIKLTIFSENITHAFDACASK